MTVNDHDASGASTDRYSADDTAQKENITLDRTEFNANEKCRRTPVAGRRHTFRSFGAMGEKG
jgi:hypothetical protein